MATGVRRILDNAADRALATRHASAPALWRGMAHFKTPYTSGTTTLELSAISYSLN